MLEALLKVQRDRVVDAPADALGFQVLAQRVAALRADRVLVEDVAAPRSANGEFDVLTADEPGVAEQAVVDGGVADAGGGPGIEMRELHAQDRGLQRVEAAVPADRLVLVAFALAVDAQYFQARSDVAVVGRYRAAVAECAEIFRWEE